MDFTTVSTMPSIKLVMTPFPYFIEVDEPLSRASELMKSHDVHHVPVQRRGELLGILDEAALLRALDKDTTGEGETPRQTPEASSSSRDADALSVADAPRVGDAALSGAFIVDLSHPLDLVLGEMIERRLGSVLVTKKQKLVGIFSTTDACKVLTQLLQAKFGRDGGEAA